MVQGKVVGVEDGDRTIRVVDEERPAGGALAFDISGAEIGNTPAVGDVVRIVYEETKNGKFVALRVMNLTRQRESKSSSH